MKVSKLIPLEALLGKSEEYVRENFVRRANGKSTGEALELIGKALQTGGNGIVESGWYGTKQAAENIYRLVQELVERLNLEHLVVTQAGTGVILSYNILREVRPVIVWEEKCLEGVTQGASFPLDYPGGGPA